MSFARFLTWLVALIVACGVGFVFARYGFGVSDWGSDAFWTVVVAIFATRFVHDALVDMWSR